MTLGFLKGFNVNNKRKATDFENKILKGIKLHTIRLDEKGSKCKRYIGITQNIVGDYVAYEL